MALAPVYIIASDDQLLKQERSFEIINQMRSAYKNAELMIMTDSDFKSTGNADLRMLENELIDPGLFASDRIIKIYLKDLNKTALQVLLLLSEKHRPGVVTIVDLPRINSTYKKITPKAYEPKAKAKGKATSLDSQLKNAFAYLYSIGATLDIIYPPEGAALEGWIRTRSQSKYGLNLDNPAIAFMALSCDKNLVIIDQTMQVMANSIDKNQIIDVETLSSYLTQDSRYTGFELAEAVLTPSKDKALNILASYCNAESSLLDAASFAISRLDAAFSAVVDARVQKVYAQNYNEQSAFFAKHRIFTSDLKKAIIKASKDMPQEIFSYMQQELARAAKFASTFKAGDAYKCLQNICMVANNFAVISLTPLKQLQ